MWLEVSPAEIRLVAVIVDYSQEDSERTRHGQYKIRGFVFTVGIHCLPPRIKWMKSPMRTSTTYLNLARLDQYHSLHILLSPIATNRASSSVESSSTNRSLRRLARKLAHGRDSYIPHELSCLRRTWTEY